MEQIISDNVRRLFDIEVPVTFTRPDPKFGDYATNIALQIAKKVGQSPREVAEKIAVELRKLENLSDVSVAGPGFINLRVKASALAESLTQVWSDTYGENSDGAGKTVIVEYPSPNMAKPYSIGHLRPGNQGWAAKQLMEASGWTVITDNHLGDYGAPFGTWVVGFLRHSSDERLERDGVYELGRVYIAMKAELKDEKEAGGHELADEVQQWLLKLERDNAEAVAYSQRFNALSLEHIHGVMQRLHILTDHEYGEAFFAPRGKAAVQDLLKKGVATQNDDGSVIVPLEEQGIKTPLLVQKSNGAALYATTDLATILFREECWRPDRVIYAVGAEQQFYFQQLAALGRKLGLTTELTHLTFGAIDQLGDDGVRAKMSSRKGVVLMESLLDMAEQKARALVGEKAVSDDDISKIALGAIKFSDFTADRRTNILFDWQTIFALSGFSGPYVQYAAVRIRKIIQDAENLPSQSADNYDFISEKQLLLQLIAYPDIIKRATAELEPHKIASYLYDLAREMNRYYEIVRILEGGDEAVRAQRIDVLKKVSQVLSHGLGMLGIEVPNQM